MCRNFNVKGQPMNLFYLQSTNRNCHYRLQSDFKWRKVNEKESISDNDYKTSSAKEIILYQQVNKKNDIDGTIQHLDFDDIASNKEFCYYEVFVLRSQYYVPTKEQLISTISKGNDDINNSLILNVNGAFELRPRESVRKEVVDPTIIARFETFIAGYEEVGIKASKDKPFIDSLYVNFLDQWESHLLTGATNYYIDTLLDAKEEELIHKIQRHIQQNNNVAANQKPIL
jgi:hypothetical protein